MRSFGCAENMSDDEVEQLRVDRETELRLCADAAQTIVESAKHWAMAEALSAILGTCIGAVKSSWSDRQRWDIGGCRGISKIGRE